MRGLDGKVALVTGAARPPGIGRATVLRLADAGADVVCVDRVGGAAPDDGGATDTARADVLDALAGEVRARGRRSVSIAADVTSGEEVDRLVAQSVAAFGRIDVACVLTGASGPAAGSGPLLDLDEASWARCLAANLTAPWLVSRAVARHMVARGGGGAVTVLSSFAGVVGTPGAGAISAARAGVNRLVQVLAVELGPHAVRVNAVCPLAVGSGEGPFRNTGFEQLVRASGAGIDGWLREHVPLGRTQDAEETAAVIAFLCSDDASFVSGESWTVAGGARAS